VFVGQHLKLDVARILDELFHVLIAVAEGVSASVRPRGIDWQLLVERTILMPRRRCLALRMTG